MRVAMIGTGYVGLVSGACFADFGHEVTCIDKDASKIERLKQGIMPIYEPGLEQLVASNVREGRLFFATEAAEAVREADAVFIAVGTPSRRGDGHADLSYVYGAAEEIADLMNGFTVLVTKSTVPVGTGTRSSASSGGAAPRRTWPWSPTRSSCARARRSTTSSAPTGWWWAPTTSAPARSCGCSTGR
jgi:nucleotide sugar dehydrogenase